MREFIGKITKILLAPRLPTELDIRAYLSRNEHNQLLDSHFHASTASNTFSLAATRLTVRQIASRFTVVAVDDDSSGNTC